MPEQPFLPQGYSHTTPPLQVYDARIGELRPDHERSLKALRDEWNLDLHSVAYKDAATTNPLEVQIHHGLHANIHLGEDAYASLQSRGAVLGHAFIKLLNQKRDRYQLRGTTSTGYRALDGIIQSYRAYRDSLMHCAVFGWVSHEAYASAITKQHVRRLEHALDREATTDTVRALRAAYITTHFSREQAALRRHTGVAQNARLLFDAFKQLTKTPHVRAHEKLRFFEHLADVETNAIDLTRTYTDNTLRAPHEPTLADTVSIPPALTPAAEQFETQLIEQLSKYHAN